jgi:hypothetical protein
MARRPLDIEAIANVTNEDGEESKSGEVYRGLMHRSDAYH